MGKFASQADATEAFLEDRITRAEYAAALDEFLAPQRARRRTAAPSKVEERPTADIRKASAELVSAKQEKALERGEDSTALQDVIDREQPRRALFGTVGKALGFVDDPRKSREELTLREQAARTFQPKIIRSPTRQLLDKGEITAEQAAEQFVIDKEEAQESKRKLDLTIVPSPFGFGPSEARVNQIVSAQGLPEGFPIRLQKVGPDADLGVRIQAPERPEIFEKLDEARKVQSGDTELDLGLALVTAGASIPYQTISQKERRKIITPLDEDRGLSLTSDGLFVMRMANFASDAGFEFLFGLPAVGLGPGDALGITEKVRLGLQKEDVDAPPTLGEVLGEDERPVITAVDRMRNAFSLLLEPETYSTPEDLAELKEIGDIHLGALSAQLKEVASLRSVGEASLGITPEERLQTRGERPLVLPDEDPVSSTLRRMMISLERGTGLSGSTEEAAVAAFGDVPEVRQLGALAGMPVEILAPWELAFTKPFSMAANSFRGAKAALRVKPSTVAQGDAVMTALQKSEIDVGQFFAEEYANRLRLGKAEITDLPEEIQQLANEAAQLRYGRTLDEILSEAGLARVTPDEIADAPLPATALSGRARGQRPAQASGAVLPEFRTPATSMADFYKKVTAGVEGEDLNVRASRRPGVQFDLSPHIGFDRLLHLDPEQTIATKSYVLLNQFGELVDSGNLNQIILKMLDRAEGGDTISFGAHRRVGEWGETRRLSSNFHFSSPDEKKIIDLFVKNNPKATPAKLRFINRGAEVVALGSRIVDPAFSKRRLLRALQGHPSTPVRRLTPQELQVATLVDDAYRLWAKGEMGSHKLDLLPWGGTATRAERNAIVSRTKADFKRAGADLAGLGLEKAPDGGLTNRLKINPSQRAQLNRLSNEVGSAVSLKEGVPFTLRELEELRIGVMRSHAEITTDASLAMRGTLPLSEFVMDSLFIATKSTNRARFRKLTKDRGHTVVERFFQDPDDLARAPRTRQLIKEFQRELANVADELLLDLQKIRAAARQAGVAEAINAAGKANVRGVYAGLDKAFGGFDVSAPLLDLMRGYRPIPPRELQVLDQIATIPAIHDAARAFELRDEVLRHVKHLKAGEFGLHSKDAGQVFDAMKQLRVRKNAEMFALTKDWIRSHIPQVSKVDERVDAILNSLKQPEIRAIYDEIYGPIRRGKDGLPLRGPMLDTFLNENFSKLDRPTMNEASVNFVLEQRFREIKTRVIGRMVEEELGITSAYFKRAVADTLAGEHTTLGAQGQVIYAHPQHIQAKVMGYMRRLGLEPESAEAMVDFNGIAVPESLKVMMDRAEQLGATNSRQVYKNAYLNKLLNLQKQNLTYGLGFLRPAYVLGNALGGLFQIHATLGSAKLFSSMKTMSGNPMMVTELIKRTGNLEGMVIVPPRSEFGRVFRTKDGAIYHIDDIEKDIRRYGVDQAIGGFENRVSLLDDAGRNNPGFVNFMKRNIVGWQEILREFSDVPERSMRIGVYLNELKAGARPADAAATARKALYDFSSLTDFERQNMRWAFMFYTFQRKNADAMLKALADHPERIAQQFRFFRNQREAFNQSDFEAASERNADLSRVILGRDDVFLADGTVHPSYRHIFYMSPPLAAPEYFLHLNEYFQAALDFDLTRMFRELGDGLTTPLKVPIELATLRDPGSGYSIESYGNNELPPYIDDEWGPFGMLGMLFDPTAVPLKRTTDQSKINPAATAELLGTPAVYVAGNPDGNPARERFSQAMWLIAKELLGSSIGEHTRRVKAFQHWNDPNPIAQDRNLLEKAWPSLYYALGLRGQKQRSPTEALREARLDREAEIKAETRDVRSKGR